MIGIMTHIWHFKVSFYIHSLLCEYSRKRKSLIMELSSVNCTFKLEAIREEVKYYFADFVRKGPPLYGQNLCRKKVTD